MTMGVFSKDKNDAVATPTPEPEAAVVGDARIGDPVDLGAADALAEATADALADADALSDEALEAALAAASASADTVVPEELTPASPDHVPSSDAVVEAGTIVEADDPVDPDDVIRATREYGDLLERGYQPNEALAELKARTEAAQ